MSEPSATTAIAPWGGVVSTVLAIVKVREHFRDRHPDVKVRLFPNVIRPVAGVPTECCEIRAVNRGRKPVTISALALQLSGGCTFNPARLDCYSREDLPATLLESQSLSADLHKAELDMRKVQWAFARDVDGNVYKSARFEGDAQEDSKHSHHGKR